MRGTKLLHGEKLAHVHAVAALHDAEVGQISFLLLGLLGQDVTLKSMFSLDLS